MQVTTFASRPLPHAVAAKLRDRLAREHSSDPFCALDVRATARRVGAASTDVGLTVTAYRGGLDLRGIEVDHLWLAAEAPGGDGPFVLDIAYPLRAPEFVDALRRFVAGDLEADDLAETATGADVDARVLGEFPAPLRYFGRPLWSDTDAR